MYQDLVVLPVHLLLELLVLRQLLKFPNYPQIQMLPQHHLIQKFQKFPLIRQFLVLLVLLVLHQHRKFLNYQMLLALLGHLMFQKNRQFQMFH
jgi:hypothetical protein